MLLKLKDFWEFNFRSFKTWTRTKMDKDFVNAQMLEKNKEAIKRRNTINTETTTKSQVLRH